MAGSVQGSPLGANRAQPSELPPNGSHSATPQPVLSRQEI